MRSQDKARLEKFSLIYVDENTRETGLYEIKGNYSSFGTYLSKERALEVLDEIQEAQLGNYHYRCPSNVKVSNNENTIVYEMPNE